MVIKPPLCFSEADAAVLVQSMRLVLSSMEPCDLESVTRTST